MNSINIVIVLPGGKEVNEKITSYGDRRSEYDYRRAAENAVCQSGLKTSRYDPKTVRVGLYTLDIVNGQLVRKLYKNFDIQPPLERMTDEQFNKEQADELKDIPEAFHPMVQQLAYDDGHSAGMEEVMLYVRRYVTALKPAIEAYDKSKN